MTFFYIILVLFLFSSLLLLGLVMLRKGEGGGLSGAFGAMGGESTFGVKAAKQVDKLIAWMAFIFLVLAIFLNHPSIRGKERVEDGEATESPADTGE